MDTTETEVQKEEEKEEIEGIGQGAPISPTQYVEAVGRRKTSVARVRIFENKGTKDGTFTVNGKKIDEYFPTEELEHIAKEALQKIKALNRFNVSVVIRGGGIHSQAEALRHGLAHALVAVNEDWRKRLKKASLLKRDPRMVERKKFGLKKARRAPQWSKR